MLDLPRRFGVNTNTVAISKFGGRKVLVGDALSGSNPIKVPEQRPLENCCQTPSIPHPRK